MSEQKVEVIEPEVLAPSQADAIVRAEVDVAVATAKRYPRSLTLFHMELEQAIAADDELCERSYYSLERSGKIIQGPSIRFAEVVLYCWRNTMTGVRIMGETADKRFVIVQAVGMDLERGTRYSEELPRRITNARGERYSDDMIAVTIRAASAIARREVYLRLVPAAVYRRHFNHALARVVGANMDQAGRITKLAERAKLYGIEKGWLLHKVKKAKLADLTEKDLLHLWGLLNSIDDGMMSLAEAFPQGGAPEGGATGANVRAAAEAAAAKAEEPAAEPTTTNNQAPADQPAADGAPEAATPSNEEATSG